MTQEDGSRGGRKSSALTKPLKHRYFGSHRVDLGQDLGWNRRVVQGVGARTSGTMPACTTVML
jgi:hypothetical protein